MTYYTKQKANISDLAEEDIVNLTYLAHKQWPDWSQDEAHRDFIADIWLENIFQLCPKEYSTHTHHNVNGVYTIKWLTASVFHSTSDELEVSELIGFAGWNRAPFATDMYELSGVCVKEEYRHRGVGELLLVERLERIQNDANRVFDIKRPHDVIVRTWDNSLYRKYGFVPAFKDVMKHPEGKSIMLAHFNGTENFSSISSEVEE